MSPIETFLTVAVLESVLNLWKRYTRQLVTNITATEDSQTGTVKTSRKKNPDEIFFLLITCKPLTPRYGEMKSTAFSLSDVTAIGVSIMSAFLKKK